MGNHTSLRSQTSHRTAQSAVIGIQNVIEHGTTVKTAHLTPHYASHHALKSTIHWRTINRYSTGVVHMLHYKLVYLLQQCHIDIHSHALYMYMYM